MGQALVNDLIIPEVKLVDLKAKFDGIDVLLIFGVGDGSLYRSLSSSWLKKRGPALPRVH